MISLDIELHHQWWACNHIIVDERTIGLVYCLFCNKIVFDRKPEDLNVDICPICGKPRHDR